MLIFKHLVDQNTRLENFSDNQSRMLILVEGLQSNNDAVREACIQFLSKSVTENSDDLSYLLTLVDCQLAFTDQYFTSVPSLLVIAILKIIQNEVALVEYLKDVVFKKLSEAPEDVTYE